VTFYGHMLTETVDLEPVDSLDADGSKSYGTKKTDLAARIERDVSVSGDSEGLSEDTVTAVWLEAEEVGKGDRIHLPSGETLEVMATETVATTDGRLDLYKAEG